jgi:hypothetical protein
LTPGEVILDLGGERDADEVGPSLSRPVRSRRRAPRPWMVFSVGRLSSPSRPQPAA